EYTPTEYQRFVSPASVSLSSRAALSLLNFPSFHVRYSQTTAFCSRTSLSSRRSFKRSVVLSESCTPRLSSTAFLINPRSIVYALIHQPPLTSLHYPYASWLHPSGTYVRSSPVAHFPTEQSGSQSSVCPRAFPFPPPEPWSPRAVHTQAA